MKQFTFIGLCCLALTLASFSKPETTIKGMVVDETNKPLIFANIILYNAVDTSVLKLEVTNEKGEFVFTGVAAGTYFVEASYLGMPNFTSKTFEITANSVFELPTVQLVAQDNELEAATVEAKKPLLEIKPDKMVMNVENSVTAIGNDALELLRKAPGVVVDNNENIQLLGKGGVQIYIDGKPSPLSGNDLAAFLKTLQAADIEAIEIITNPSSRYDAEGNGGIINIKLKRAQNLGANANINLTYSQGEVAQYNGSIGTNYRNKVLNAFGSYTRSDGENIYFTNFYREQFGLGFDQLADQGQNWKNNNFRVGSDFYLNKKHTLGFLINGFSAMSEGNSESRSLLFTLDKPGVDSLLIASSDSDNDRINSNFNINYRFDNSKGRTWNIDADYGVFRIDGVQLQPNFYKDPTEQFILRESTVYLDTPTDIDIYTFKVDHELPFAKGKLGAGGKVSYVKTDNTFDFYNVIDKKNVLNTEASNEFTYTENVNALYANYSQQAGKIGIQAGLRLEQTNSEGALMSLVPTDEDNVKRSYLDVFPSAGITYQLNEKNTFQINYSRRINRPNYQDLNPFRQRLDEITFEKGNPFLQPEYTNKFQITHTFNYSINTTLSFDHTKDLIGRLTDAESETSAFITYQNIANRYNYSLNVSGAVPIKEWWSTYTSLTGLYQYNEAAFEDGNTLKLGVTTFNMYMQQTFTLPKDLSFEVSGFYSSPSIWEGAFKTEDIWQLNAGVAKKILKGQGSLKLNINDIFKSQRWSGVSQFGDLYMRASGGWDSRRVALNFSYFIGNNKVRSQRRNTGLEDESSRIKSDN
jgi:outer membrane receptor protein involved in Fe transport